MRGDEPGERLRRQVRGFYAWLGSVLLAGMGPVVASRLVEKSELVWRAAGVAVGIVAWVPMMIVIALIIQRGDEFQRRIHLVALAIAFAGALLLISALDWLARAELMQPPQLSVLWLVIAVLWFITIMVTNWYYARQR